MKMVAQPEIAYVLDGGRRKWATPAPPGQFWLSYWQEIPDDATEEEFHSFLLSMLEIGPEDYA